MAAVIIRNIPEATHRALKLRAARNGRSTEAEIRKILEETVATKANSGLGSQLAALGRRFGGVKLEITRDPRPARPAKFS
jgi:antitoxin FitA